MQDIWRNQSVHDEEEKEAESLDDGVEHLSRAQGVRWEFYYGFTICWTFSLHHRTFFSSIWESYKSLSTFDRTRSILL
jgi:hypothetical protein